MGNEISDSGIKEYLPLRIDGDHPHLWCKFHHYLSAGSTGSAAILGRDHNCLEILFAGSYSMKDSIALSANCQGIGCVFHITAAEDFSAVAQ